MNEVSLRDALVEEIIIQAEKNTNICVVDCDMAIHTRLQYFFERYPERSFQCGISEQHAISFAAGLASCGMIPIVASFSSFIVTNAWEQIRHSISYNMNNVKIIGTHAGVSAAEDGGTHQSFEDVGLMRLLPEMIVLAPIDNIEAKEMVKFFLEIQSPVYVRVGRNPLPQILSSKYVYKYGEPVLLREGKEIVLITSGEYSQVGIIICKELEQKYDITIKHIHIPTLNYVDEKKLIEYLVNCKYIFVVDEHFGSGGLCDLMLKTIKNENCSFQIQCIYIEKFGETGSEVELRKELKIDKESIQMKIVRCVLRRKLSED